MKTKRKCREISFLFFLGWFDGAGSLYFPLILKVVLCVLLSIHFCLRMYICGMRLYMEWMEGIFMLHWAT